MCQYQAIASTDELFVVYNGPEIGEAEDVLSEALDLHFKDSRGWHFTTNNLFKSSGPTVTLILKRKNKLNIYEHCIYHSLSLSQYVSK